jgi:hypothetical protein
MRNTWMLLAITTFCVLALTAIRVGAQSVQPTSETYSWSGELVSFDANGRTITVKSRVVGDPALKELPPLSSRFQRAVSGRSSLSNLASGSRRHPSIEHRTRPRPSRR